ncbi:MAG: EutN/CcmL family microcompartment protein [Actinobacteria bacterium]|nr:EutN/CcmL family microcompartment protein [Actinomycetota bacterium]
MILARVIGTVVSTCKFERIQNSKILAIQPIDLDGKPIGRTQTTIDTIGPRAGEIVLVCMDGDVASEMIGIESTPVRSCVVGILDYYNVDSKSLNKVNSGKVLIRGEG